MLTSCLICAELLSASSEVYATRCGHAFHHTCLLQWLERSPTCPQCRSKTTEKRIFRMYFNFANTTGITLDAGSLQSKLDNVEFDLSSKNGEISKLKDEVVELQKQAAKSEKKLKKTNDLLAARDMTISCFKQQLEYMKNDHDDVKRLQAEIDSLKDKVALLNNVEVVLNGATSEVDDMLKEMTDTNKLCTYISVLKKAVVESESKKKVLRESIRALHNQVMRLTSENKELAAKHDNVSEMLEAVEKMVIAQEELAEVVHERNLKRTFSADEGSSSSKAPRLCPTDADRDAHLEHSESNKALSRIKANSKSIESSTSPYLQLRQSSSALTALQLKRPSTVPYSYGKGNELSIFASNRPSDRLKHEVNGDLYKASLSRRPDPESFFDGMGGHSKPDAFPVPAEDLASLRKRMKDKFKRVRKPSSQATIMDSFKKL